MTEAKMTTTEVNNCDG